MKRGRLLIAVVLLISAGLGVGAWRLERGTDSALPQISVYSRGQTERVSPYLYCNVVDLNDCTKDGAQSELAVDDRNPVQLSVPSAIGRAPWRLLTVYDDERNSTTTVYRPDSRLAVTIPTIDPQRGRVAGIAVQLMTLVQDQKGELHDVPHAEWSVKLDWT